MPVSSTDSSTGGFPQDTSTTGWTSETTSVSSSSGQGCQGGDRKDCDDVTASQCYSNQTRQDCCETCDDLRIPVNIPGCPFGDRIQSCSPDQPWRCYDNSYRFDCCYTCENAYEKVAGCEYGDKVNNCVAEKCYTYSTSRREDCCDTCSSFDPSVTSSTVSWWSSTSPSKPLTSSQTSSTPAWIAPVAGCVGGILVIALVLFIVLWWRRRKQGPQNLSPIDDKMYNDYKLSKRAPMALPRDQDPPIKDSLVRQESAEYAYIHPDDVTSTPDETEKGRSGNDPLPATPNGPTEYLELGQPDKYGYLEPLGTTVKNDSTLQSSDFKDSHVQYENEKTHRSNTYQKFPGDKNHVTQANESVTQANENSQSESFKM